VQQIGTPEQLHTEPANWHVADFMGYRNLLPLRAGPREPGGIVVEIEGHQLTGTPVGDPQPGDDVVAGIRPEDLRIGAADGPGVPATVEVVEYQGREVAVEARTDGGIALNLRTADRPAVGDRITVTVEPRRLLVFPAGDPR
jgi:putative spermidine/putrescine transport system ATP-binding protein